MPGTSDTRITGYEPLLSPAALLDELPLAQQPAATVERTRAEVRGVLDGDDDRLLVIAGPCSVHDPKAALDYARRLAAHQDKVSIQVGHPRQDGPDGEVPELAHSSGFDPRALMRTRGNPKWPHSRLSCCRLFSPLARARSSSSRDRCFSRARSLGSNRSSTTSF